MSTDTPADEVTAHELAAELHVDVYDVLRAISLINGVNGFPEGDVDWDGDTYLGPDGAQRVRDWLAANADAVAALRRVRDANEAFIAAGHERLAAIKAARPIPNVTMEAIAHEIGMTRDGVYKLLRTSS